MDTGATSHLNSNAHNLSTLFNSRLYPSIHVGDGNSIPVTNTGHSIIPSLHRPLHLHNVLVTPNIIKNLISVRQFTRDNNCTIEFDAFGFSVKDFLTRHILLRCDSSGDLYPVTKPSTVPAAFVSTSSSTWHQRLGHPGDDVLRSLSSRHLISCNKERSPHVCHACQLGKHVKLPFHSSISSVKQCFDIIHSDLWTSPIVSSSGFKYYVLFLDHFSHYLWIYPLKHKSDMFGKFVHFRKYVQNQFKCDIKSFQCDHGACPKSKKQVTPNPPEGGSKATSEGDWIKVQKKGKGKDPERISDRLEDPVSHAPLAFNSQGEHSEGKPALAFSTPTGISLGGSSEPLTLSPDHKPLGGCEPKERLDGMKLDQRERKHDQSDLVSEAGREGIEAHGAKIKAASAFRSALWLLAIKSEVTFGRGETSTWDNLSLGYDLNSTFKKEPDQANQEIGSDEGERELLLKEGESLLLVAIKW
ncbi:ribonuclease H-like domain-containing protein [Tanacetum coccineum]